MKRTDEAPAPQPSWDRELPRFSAEVLGEAPAYHPPPFLQIQRYRMRVRFPDGSSSPELVYDVVDRSALDAVVICAHFIREGEHFVYLRSAFRPPVFFRPRYQSPDLELGRGVLWELPAGLIEPAELRQGGVVAAARRETREELGFDCEEDDFIPMGPSSIPCASVLGERQFFLHVEVEPSLRTEPSLDGSPLEEQADIIEIPLRRALDWCREGRVEDAKTEIGLRRLQEELKDGNA